MDYHTMPTTRLAYELTDAINEDSQIKINAIAYELAYRFYIPYNGKLTFEELLETYGYKDIKKQKENATGKSKLIGR